MHLNKTLSTLAIALMLAASFFAGWLLRAQKCPKFEPIEKTDTLFIRDTIIELKPVAATVRKLDTIMIPVRDTVIIRDTTFMLIDREQKHYSSEDYEAWVSGYRPALDSIRVFPETKYITAEKIISVNSRKRWGLGLQAGYGVGLQGRKPIGTPYIGIGISYNLLQW